MAQEIERLARGFDRRVFQRDGLIGVWKFQRGRRSGLAGVGAVDQAFEEAVGAEAIGAVESAASHFAGCP